MKCVLYLRVSTNEETQDVNNQRQPLLKLAEALKFEYAGEYVDYASGGKTNRPEFQRMLKDSSKHEFDMILVWALDRFSREGILNTLSYMKTLKQNNVAIKSLQESWLDTRDDGMSNLLLAIFSWVAQQEKQRISDRVKAGLVGKINVGKRGSDKKVRKKGGYIMRYMKTK